MKRPVNLTFIISIIFISIIFTGIQLFMNCAPAGLAKDFPQDLRIEGTAGGMHPWEENRTILLTAEGYGNYTRYIPGKVGSPPLEEIKFSLNASNLDEIWKVINENDFFNLKPDYINNNVSGGAFATLTVKAKGKIHRVNLQNMNLPRFETIIEAINKVLPSGKGLVYKVG